MGEEDFWRVKMDEYEAKELLKSSGIDVPPGQRVMSEGEIDFGGRYPKIVKVCSSQILHKSDVGGVIAGIRDATELRMAFNEILKKFPGKRVLIEEMITARGIEAIVGVGVDRDFGRYIMVGVGGVLAELYKDVSFRLLPIKRGDAVELVESLRGKKLFQGFRGVNVNLEAFYGLIEKVSGFAQDREIDDMDLNPVFISERAIVLDAKIVGGKNV